MNIEALRDKAAKLPLKPGVYIMSDGTGEVIYVGKAKKLKNRVSSYFHGAHNAKTEAMVSHVADFNVIIAASEFEALVLESQLIKHHMPKYNILLKDDKGYPFIRLDRREAYPRFTIAAERKDDGAAYFGPYGGRSVSRMLITEISKALLLPTCSRVFPRDIGKARPCLEYHIGGCAGYCLEGASHDEYLEAVDRAVMILQGKTGGLIGSLREEMEQAAEALQFERAAVLRDRLKAVSALRERQMVLTGEGIDTDAVGFYRGEAKSCFAVLHYVAGRLLAKDWELVESPIGDDAEALSQLLRLYYADGRRIPQRVLLPYGLPDGADIEKLFSEAAERRVSVYTPQRGEKKRWSDAAQENAREETERATSAEERRSKTAQWLQNALSLPAAPDRIEAFDVSNTGGGENVASMTVFRKGKPLKSAYRKFIIKTVEGQDDYASMREAVSRRAARSASGDEKFAPLPDLMLIDGGEEHARAAVAALREQGLDLPVFGMVKDDRHRTRALVTPEGEEIGIAAYPPAFAFIGTIQEETHRFAIEFHRKKREQKSFASRLSGIPNVGKTRAAALIKAFGSVRAIAAAELADLEKVVPKNAAGAVYERFHGENNAESGEEEEA